MVDLHVHSTRSDGSFTPTELVDYAIEKGLSAFALTDHDTVDGITEATEYAESIRAQGKISPRVIPGIEFSTEHEGKDIHVVGLFININTPAFKDYLSEFVSSRENRNLKMCNKFVEAGIDISYEELKSSFPGAVITRAHYAKLLLSKGYVKSLPEAFERYIGDNAPFYIPREKVTPKMAIDLILKAGGVPILAHPILYHMSKAKLDNFTGELKEQGLMGIEAIYSTYATADERQIRELANKYHLLLSGGSDFHGSNKQGIDLGTGYGKLYIGDEILKDIETAAKNILFTDMDGTLLLKDSTISPDMKEAIDKLIQRGHNLVLTSGRPLPSILERKIKLGLDFPGMWIISNNGGLIYDCAKDRIIYEEKLSPDIIRTVAKFSEEAQIHAHCYTDKAIVGLVEDEELAFYRRRVDMPFIKVDDMADYLKDGTYKIQLISLTDKKALIKLKESLENELQDKANLVFSNEFYLEVLPKNVSKGNAIKYLSDYLHIPHSHTFAAGDEDNDISMLDAAMYGIAMANATPAVKEHANIVTTNDNNHDGLLEIIEKYFM